MVLEKLHSILGPAAGLLGLLALAPFSPAQAIAPGDAAAYAFRSSPLNGAGLQRLEELRGRPVLIEFWGLKCPPCIGSAVPMALKMAETHKDDLGLLLVESQGHTPEQVAAFALERKWFGTGAMWTTERPFQTGARGVPNYVLLSAEGRVLLMGNPITDHKKIDEAISQEIRRSRAVPDGAPRELVPAWREIARGNAGKAIALAARLAEAGEGEPAAAASAAVQEFRSRLETRFRRAEWLAENGHFQSADEALKELVRAVTGDAGLEERAARLRERLSDRSLQAERAAERHFLRLERGLFENGPGDPIVRGLRQFAEKNQGTRAAERARFWVELLG